MAFNTTIKKLVDIGSENMPTICSIGAGVCTIGAVFETGRGMHEADKIIAEKELKTKEEKIRGTWKCFLKAAGLTALSLGFTAGAWWSGRQKYLAMAASLEAYKRAQEEYKKAVQDEVGEKKERQIQNRADAQYIDKYGFDPRFVKRIGAGNTLFKDSVTGQYCIGSVGDIYNAIARANYMMSENMDEPYISYDDVLELIGMDVPEGENRCDIGFNIQDDYIDVDLSKAFVMRDDPDITGIIINYRKAPTSGYDTCRQSFY